MLSVALSACSPVQNKEDDVEKRGYNTEGLAIVFNPPLEYCTFTDMEDNLYIESHEMPDLRSYLPVDGFSSFPVSSLLEHKIDIDNLCLSIGWISGNPITENNEYKDAVMKRVSDIHKEYESFPISSNSLSDLLRFNIYHGHHFIQDIKFLFIPTDSADSIDLTKSVTIHTGHPFLGALVSDDENAPLCIPWPEGIPASSYIALHPLVNCQLLCVLDPSKTSIKGKGHFKIRFSFTDGTFKEAEENMDLMIIRSN